jgi:serine/threonine protein kinase
MLMKCPACDAENDPSAEGCFTCGGSLTLVIKRGSVIASRYEILDSLGKGGMGVVYKAHDRVLEEEIAIKVLRADIARSPDLARRFRAEIKLARKVTHRNVCRIHEYGEDQGVRYISMELIEGVDLKHLIRERHGGLPPAEAFDVATQVARGLSAIHDVGIVHRDLKTANIMLDRRGHVKLMDFGIAKEEKSTGATATGDVVGTPEYMSPEQARGQRVDARSDLYALAVVIYEIFSGDVPFRGDTPIVTIFKHIQEQPLLEGPGAHLFPEALIPVLRKGLAKEPDERYSSADDVVEALRLARATVADAAPAAPVSAPSAGADFTPAPTSYSPPTPPPAAPAPAMHTPAPAAYVRPATVRAPSQTPPPITPLPATPTPAPRAFEVPARTPAGTSGVPLAEAPSGESVARPATPAAPPPAPSAPDPTPLPTTPAPMPPPTPSTMAAPAASSASSIAAREAPAPRPEAPVVQRPPTGRHTRVGAPASGAAAASRPESPRSAPPGDAPQAAPVLGRGVRQSTQRIPARVVESAQSLPPYVPPSALPARRALALLLVLPLLAAAVGVLVVGRLLTAKRSAAAPSPLASPSASEPPRRLIGSAFGRERPAPASREDAPRREEAPPSDSPRAVEAPTVVTLPVAAAPVAAAPPSTAPIVTTPSVPAPASSTAATLPTLVLGSPAAPPATPRPQASPPPSTQPAAPQPGAQVANLLAQAEAAVAANRHEQAVAHFDEVLKLEPQHTKALEGRATALAIASSLKKTFVAGKTSFFAKPKRGEAPGFGGSEEQGDADYLGRIEFEFTPSAVKPGDSFRATVSFVNEGKKTVKIRALTAHTLLNTSRTQVAKEAETKEISPQQRGRLFELQETWKGGTKAWNLVVVINSERGESYRAELSWR